VIIVETEDWLLDLIRLAKGLGMVLRIMFDLGPIISPQSKAKIETLIAKGGKILFDGHKLKAP
jgi:hypothetical protein